MEQKKGVISLEQFQNILNILNSSMDDFLYIYDLNKDFYCISPSAMDRFAMDACEFYQAREQHNKFVYPEDRELLERDLQDILTGQKDNHNLQYRWIGRDGRPVWINCRGQVICSEEGKPKYLIGCINEIGKQPKADNTSGLLRDISLEQELTRHTEYKQGFLMSLGVDNFKEINENRGVEYGDMVLQQTAKCIETVLAPEQKLYRIVADEFAVVDLTGRDVEEAQNLYQQIQDAIGGFIEENGYEVFYTISAGILPFERVQDQNYSNLRKLSEFCLAEAKDRGKNQCYIYEKEDYRAFLEKKKLIQILRKAVNHHFEGFEAYFQPIMDIQGNQLASAEVLLRFQSQETGAVSPAVFIPLLEESSLIIPVGRFVLDKAMEACSRIQKTIPDFRVSVNLSYIQVRRSNMLTDLKEGMQKYHLEPGSVVVELTESGFLESDAGFVKFCNELRENGILLALDDFGTGYSNFHYLYNLCPDTIKIDRGFTVKALENDYEYNLLHHMVDMVHSIDLKLCVEGIETKEELARIREINPDFIQGFYFGKPCPYDTFVSEHIREKFKRTTCGFS